MLEDEIYERMVDTIRNHRLPPGTKLVEDRLATAFGVSRTRIRPVLVRLANERIVTMALNRGASVAQPDEAEAREVFEVRRLIEPTLLARFVERARPADIAQLARCIADEEAARAAGDLRRAVRCSGDFHLLIAAASGQQTLDRILRELVSRTSLVLMAFASRPQAEGCGCTAHRALLAAIRLRDAEAAGRLMLEHLAQLEAQLQFTPEEPAAPDLLALFAGA
ncbi:GntR family transcriptional regulator [Paucibacter sp. R3-3]|uniref:GntR family transcriptional regulator n=1 Tax=Roseateles agri TaxID=3098619 RepID=A0ABU5DBZ9_9BURK|nr:GntR family transcriptional regulator [Paucibacter sp. R3-3]MDY0743809.1 GntR family transcriptional regulator [Paucibacter sp. R3-3]